jgi:general secretion pathway protein K
MLDWLDEDDLARPDGAEAPFYETRRITPRNGNLLSIEELASLRGFTPQVVARMRPYVTAQQGTIPFDRRYASAAAVAAMTAGAEASPEAIEAAREAAGQRTALQFIDKKTLVGRPISLVAEAQTAQGGKSSMAWVVMLTGRAAHPWVVLQAE